MPMFTALEVGLKIRYNQKNHYWSGLTQVRTSVVNSAKNLITVLPHISPFTFSGL